MLPRHLRPPVVAAVVALALGASACRGADDPTGGPGTTSAGATSTTDPATSPAAYPTFADPAQDVVVPVGRRFGLVVVTAPAQGRRWALTAPPDPAVALPLGTELSPAGAPPLSEGEVQVVTFVASGEGTTAVELVEVGADGTPVAGVEPVAFAIVVTLDGLPPTTSTTSTTVPGGASGGG